MEGKTDTLNLSSDCHMHSVTHVHVHTLIIHYKTKSNSKYLKVISFFDESDTMPCNHLDYHKINFKNERESYNGVAWNFTLQLV